MEYEITRNKPVGQDWLNQIFNAKSAANGGVIRRKIKDVDREVGRERFELEVRRRGFHLFANGQDFIVICNNAPIAMIC
ncbi:N-(5'-phosphoribosyl)anthranilate isomerase [Yoonia sediminilitoris]|uniref:N-(5'-phosphoribosyl)anthranilate isomerase n=1 Tax=Yoonia sediminilitoris TaxID=1286148 RepID=A0A2T6K911_9RHOB|nr:N-(5'-phosphoribosyl)anthranilate isomerase [Yoonia sediminilitoris]PUB11243.1 hypothetical protein C8N45_11415 [Yoonia sediminilitoris]RCW91059.1 hypothetical protein DFP92_11415 [Yoonia sediminilitoris]